MWIINVRISGRESLAIGLHQARLDARLQNKALTCQKPWTNNIIVADYHTL